MYIDTHAHLNFKAFNDDWQQAIERAKKADVSVIINVGSNYKTSLKAIEIAKKSDNVFAAVGLHPIHVKDGERSRTIKDEEFEEERFLKLAKDKKVVAIGETGLDYYSRGITRFHRQAGSYYYDKSTKDSQKEVFQKHLNLAMAVSKPIILHSRDASEDILSILMAQRVEPLGVMHCFAGDWPTAKLILDMGLYLSFTGLITFTKNYETFEVIKNMPLERLLLETDCPYMTPELHRGKRNEPAYVVEVAKKIAEIKKIPLEKIEEQTTQNTKKLFKLT